MLIRLTSISCLAQTTRTHNDQSKQYFSSLLCVPGDTFALIQQIWCIFTANEISTIEWRTETSAWVNILTGVTHTIFPWICYGLQEWRYVHFLISILGLPFLIISLFLPESPRYELKLYACLLLSQNSPTKVGLQ